LSKSLNNDAVTKYNKLYDFVPSGLFTLSKDIQYQETTALIDQTPFSHKVCARLSDSGSILHQGSV
jgi:hypothetical protein